MMYWRTLEPASVKCNTKKFNHKTTMFAFVFFQCEWTCGSNLPVPSRPGSSVPSLSFAPGRGCCSPGSLPGCRTHESLSDTLASIASAPTSDWAPDLKQIAHMLLIGTLASTAFAQTFGSAPDLQHVLYMLLLLVHLLPLLPLPLPARFLTYNMWHTRYSDWYTCFHCFSSDFRLCSWPTTRDKHATLIGTLASTASATTSGSVPDLQHVTYTLLWLVHLLSLFPLRLPVVLLTYNTWHTRYSDWYTHFHCFRSDFRLGTWPTTHVPPS